MSRLPLLIGVSGKRTFDDDNAANDKSIAESVRGRFNAIFAKLDRDYRHTPKILLTGAAFGTDLIAAQAVLDIQKAGNTGWAIIALLPFRRDEFRKDFEPGAKHREHREWLQRFAQHKADFETLMRVADQDEGHHAVAPRVIARELPALSGNPAQGGPDPAPTLAKREGESNTFRDAHYEQVGQFIAESAMIMIAVAKPEEAADPAHATGGTNRIVAYRRAGHDKLGAAVADQSRVLRRTKREPIAPPARFVWLIDPLGKSPSRGPDDYPVSPLAPLTTHSTSDSYKAATTKGPDDARGRDLAISLLLADRLDRFNAKLEGPDDLVAHISPIPPQRLTGELNEVTEVIGRLQMQTNWLSRVAFKAMAALFVLAVFTFEIFAKFYTERPSVLAGYLGLLILIGLIVWVAQWQWWQPDAEDYRAVAEMLRVQHAWWSAGLDERADREHLQGASNDLAPVRHAGTAIIAWLVMRAGWPEPLPADWSAVRDPGRTPGQFPLSRRRPTPWIVRKALEWWDKLRGSKQQEPLDWIGSQLSYFAAKTPLRRDAVHITEAASWTLFAASGFLGAILLVFLLKGPVDGHWLYYRLEAGSVWPNALAPRAGNYFSPALWTLLVIVAIFIRIGFRGIKRWKATALSLVIGAIMAFLLSLALISAAPTPDFTERALIVLLVGLSAIAGAWRYLTERLNIEAEAHEYRDAHVRFDRAEHLLAAEPDEGRARAIVFELGRLALAENEAWLKSRRERPLTPVVG